jgi:hypothetical protein
MAYFPQHFHKIISRRFKLHFEGNPLETIAPMLKRNSLVALHSLDLSVSCINVSDLFHALTASLSKENMSMDRIAHSSLSDALPCLYFMHFSLCQYDAFYLFASELLPPQRSERDNEASYREACDAHKSVVKDGERNLW